jgi:hypothetical protein
MRSTRTIGTTVLREDEYIRLEAEGCDLLKQRDIALDADPRSEMYRQYVARMRAHLAALAVYLDLPRPAM